MNGSRRCIPTESFINSQRQCDIHEYPFRRNAGTGSINHCPHAKQPRITPDRKHGKNDIPRKSESRSKHPVASWFSRFVRGYAPCRDNRRKTSHAGSRNVSQPGFVGRRYFFRHKRLHHGIHHGKPFRWFQRDDAILNKTDYPDRSSLLDNHHLCRPLVHLGTGCHGIPSDA